jgi:predicted GIY-YIG superfamily endonuclease
LNSRLQVTQIISAVTQEYVLLASDRRLTYGEGARKGEEEIKAWRRAKKIALIESLNPQWNALSLHL